MRTRVRTGLSFLHNAVIMLCVFWYVPASIAAEGHGAEGHGEGYDYEDGAIDVASVYTDMEDISIARDVYAHAHTATSREQAEKIAKIKTEYDLEKQAEDGDAQAQYKLALHYIDGGSYYQARQWLVFASEKQYAPATTMLARFYASGRAGYRNMDKALSLYREAAKLDDAEALGEIASFYCDGTILPPDIQKAVLLFKKAAARNDARSQAFLAAFYMTGFAVDRDKNTAITMANASAKQGDRLGLYVLGAFYYTGEGVKQDRALAAWYFKQAAEKGDFRAQNILGAMYQYGNGVDQDDDTALSYYLMAARQGYVRAMHNAGYMYHLGKAQDYVEAYAWYSLAAANGVDDSAYNIKDVYQMLKPAQRIAAEEKAASYKSLYHLQNTALQAEPAVLNNVLAQLQ